ncbi:MAG: HAMP domain-containing histidine kinase [Candidatus Krumholzibacteriota bacterium]|nr:HAMP domain-containing histidine kinase [Candidatus Krumholzibacteriota bacterium]
MQISKITEVLKKLRTDTTASIESSITAVEDAISQLVRVEASVLELPIHRTVYLSRALPGLSHQDMERLLETGSSERTEWINLDGGFGEVSNGEKYPLYSVTKVPIHGKDEVSGYFSVVTSGDSAIERDKKEFLEELVLAVFPSAIAEFEKNRINDSNADIKEKFLKGTGNSLLMKETLLGMMDRTGAEFCAYYSESGEINLHILLASRELSVRIPDIREKLIKTNMMFSNSKGEESPCRDRVYLKSGESNISYLIGNSEIKSYFLVPVISGLRVSGTLFFGSIRSDAFLREDIEYIKNLADREDSEKPVIYRMGGQLDILGSLVDQLTIPCALISHDGYILSSNLEFSSLLKLSDEPHERISSLDEMTPFYFSGIWNEFQLIGADIKDRELYSAESNDSCLSVDMIHLHNLSKETGSLLLIRDISEKMVRESEREEILAVTAHELRTPMTALKNSLKIIAESRSESIQTGGTEKMVLSGEGRFFDIAIRTIDRLNLLVNGLVDTSSVRKYDHSVLTVETDTRHFLEDASRLFTASMEKKDISFTIEVEKNASRLVFDQMMMEQVIQNLLSNSLKYVPSGGSIALIASSSEDLFARYDDAFYGLIKDPRFAEIVIADSGPGIPDEVSSIFSVAGNDSLKSKNPVRGLGLYIANKIITMHGGSLHFENPGYKGSSISIRIPADRETGDAARSIGSVCGQIDSSISKGYHPVVYSMFKETDGCWFDIAAEWKVRPDISPLPGSVKDRGIYLWPVNRDAALAMTLDKRSQDNPLFFMNKSRGGLSLVEDDPSDHIVIGWSVFPIDGKISGELIRNAATVKIHKKVEIT